MEKRTPRQSPKHSLPASDVEVARLRVLPRRIVRDGTHVYVAYRADAIFDTPPTKQTWWMEPDAR